MGRYRTIDVRMWGDAKFRSLSAPDPNGQTLWVFLLTGEHTSIVPGLFRAGELSLAEALGWSPQAFRKAFQEVFAKGMAKADWKARLVFLPNAVHYNPPQSPNVVKAWRAAFDELPECSLKVEAFCAIKSFLETLPEAFRKAFGKPLPNQDQEQEQEQDQEQEQNSARRRARERLSEVSTWFETEFVPAYPEHRRVQNKSALAELRELKPDATERAQILAALERWKCSAEWARDGGTYVPGMGRFFSDGWHKREPEFSHNHLPPARAAPVNRSQAEMNWILERKARKDAEEAAGGAVK
jgi:hypothetical protein